MSDISRPLNTDEQIRQFLDVIDFKTYFSDARNREYAFRGMDNIDAMMGKAITLIKEANDGMAKVLKFNTLVSPKNRSLPYKTNKCREKLRNLIIKELKTKVRPDDDEDICLGCGGMLPTSGEPKLDRKAFILIGLPAAGKSGVAAKLSDYYSAVLIDSDFVKRKIPEYHKSNGASLVHEESKYINDKIKIDAIREGVNIVLPVIGADYEHVAEAIDNLREGDYQVSVVLVELERVKSTQRAFSRFMHTNRYVPLSMILDGYSNNPSLTFYRLLSNDRLKDIPMVLIDSDVPIGERQKISIERNFPDIHKII